VTKFSLEEIKDRLNTAMLTHLKEIHMTPFSVFEVSGRAMLYVSMLHKHYNFDDKGFALIIEMAKTVTVPGVAVHEDPSKKSN